MKPIACIYKNIQINHAQCCVLFFLVFLMRMLIVGSLLIHCILETVINVMYLLISYTDSHWRVYTAVPQLPQYNFATFH